MEKSNFLRIKCPRCSNRQTTYGRATMLIKCIVCNKLLIRPRGGKAKVRAEVKYVIK